MISTKCLIQSFDKLFFVLFIVLLMIAQFICTVDGLSTANDRGKYDIYFISFHNEKFSSV